MGGSEMPGKIIDRIVLSAVCTGFFYIFFLNAWGSILLACAASFLCCAILRRLILRRPVHFKCSHARAEAILMGIASMDDESACAELENLVRLKYPKEEFVLAPAAKYPGSILSAADVFAQWKKHRSEKNLLIVATCPADTRAVLYARELDSPKVAILDRRRIIRIIRTTNSSKDDSPSVPLFMRLRRIPQNLIARSASVKNASFSVLLVFIYLVTGNPVCLFTGLCGLFLFGCSLPRIKVGRRLF